MASIASRGKNPNFSLYKVVQHREGWHVEADTVSVVSAWQEGETPLWKSISSCELRLGTESFFPSWTGRENQLHVKVVRTQNSTAADENMCLYLAYLCSPWSQLLRAFYATSLSTLNCT